MRRSGFVFATTIAALSLWAAPAGAQQPQQFEVKIGVLNDMSSLYQDTTGPGSLLGVRMAVEDYMKMNPKSALKVTVISADHQNKPDIGSNIARQWYQVENVDAIIDVPNSAVALAVADITKQYNKVNLNASADTTRLTGDALQRQPDPLEFR
jgi:branched-chain amino acid transport system substrate-binding protein